MVWGGVEAMWMHLMLSFYCGKMCGGVEWSSARVRGHVGAFVITGMTIVRTGMAVRE